MRTQGSHVAFVPLLILSFLVAACATPDAITPTSVVRRETALAIATSTGVALSTPPRTMDDEMMAVAIEAPGFAGMFIEKGVLITLVSSRANRQSVDASVRRWSESRGAVLPSTVVWRNARFDFSVLYGARQAIRRLRFSGLRYIDIDEYANRVVVAVASPGDSASAWDAVVRAVDSASAVSVVVAPSIQRASSLSDFVRPLAAGMQITMLDATHGPCTAGPIARNGSSGNRWMITNSHCTNYEWGLDGSVVHQPFVWNPWNTRVGVEMIDPQPDDSGACDYEFCRWSDAAAILLDSSNTPFKIAKTTWLSIVPGDTGSRTLATDGNFTVEGTVPLSNLFVGLQLHKVGKTSGWTVGAVTRTCVDVWVTSSPSFWLRCQYAASGTGAGGDSGSPVFQWYGAAPSYAVNVAGIMWGSYLGSEIWFSPWQNITYDLGPFVPHP